MGMVQHSVFCNQFNSLTHTQLDRYFFFKFEYTSWVNHSIVCIRPVSDKNRVFVSVSYEFSGYPMAWPILSISSTAHEALHQIRTRNSDKSTSPDWDWWWFRCLATHHQLTISDFGVLGSIFGHSSTIFGMIPIGRSPPSWDGIPIDGSMDLFFFAVWDESLF